MIFDYETLKMLWWLLIGVLLIGFAITDGMDMGVAMLLRLVGKTDSERRTVINTIGATGTVTKYGLLQLAALYLQRGLWCMPLHFRAFTLP